MRMTKMRACRSTGMVNQNSKNLREATIEEKVYVASQWQLMWWKFRRHKMA